MKFWALASSLALFCTASTLWGQAYGELGTSENPVTRGFDLTKQGLRVSQSGGSLFAFDEPLTGWAREFGNDRTAQWTIKGGRHAPTHMRANVRTPGFDFKVRTGFRLKISTLGQPLLSVAEATYQGVSTPQTRWCLLSFREEQPPILFGFVDGTSSIKVTGTPGQWEIRFSPSYEGWIRLALPFGHKKVPGSGNLVSRVGAASRRCQEFLEMWSRPAPKTMAYQVLRDSGELTVRWTFDRSGVVIPPRLLLAETQGSLRLSSPYQTLTRETPFGLFAATTSKTLEVRFPARPLIQGSYLVQGAPPDKPSASQDIWASWFPHEGLAELRSQIQGRYAAAPWGPIPGSRGFGFAPSGPDQWTAHSALALAHSQLLSRESDASQANLALTTTLWARDPLELKTPGTDSARDQAAIACLLSPEPTRQAEGFLLAAGIAASRSLAAEQAAHGFAVTPAVALSPTLAYLAGVSPSVSTDLWATTSPIKVESGPSCWVRKTDKGWALTWLGGSGQTQTLVLTSRITIRGVALSNITKLDVAAARGRTRFTATADRLGICEVLLRFDDLDTLTFPTRPIPPASG